MKFHHIGIACKNITEELENIRKIHKIVSETPIIFDANQQANLCMVTLEDGLNIEFVSGKPVENLLKKRISYYHICYEVENIAKCIDDLLAKDAVLISDPKEAILFENRRVAFLLVSYGIIELLEKK